MSRSLDKYADMMRVEDRSSHGEVTTPVDHAVAMLDQIPEVYFISNTTTFLDPCFGNGTFIIELIKKLKSYGHSIENIETRVFGCEISKRLANKVKKRLAKYNFDGIILGDSLEREWNMKFDVVIGNPPYQKTESKEKKAGTPIWQKFFQLAVECTKDGGTISLIHPNGYRVNKSKFKKVFNALQELDVTFLQTSTYQTGFKLFGVGTTADWYVVSKRANTGKTVVRDANGVEKVIDISKVSVILDEHNEFVNSLLAKDGEERVELAFSQKAYYTPKKYMSKEQSDEFKHPVAYTVTQKKGLSFWWSSEDQLGLDEGMHSPKVIVSNGAGCYPVVDAEGRYGLTQFTYGIVDSPENLDEIAEVMNTDKFAEVMTALGSGNSKYSREALSLLKKDFYKGW